MANPKLEQLKAMANELAKNKNSMNINNNRV